MRPLRSHQPQIACALLLLYLPACTSTHFVAAPPPAQLVETARPPSIRVTSTNGTTYTLASPAVSGDSLVGTVGPRDATRTISLALSEVRSASIEQPSAITWQVGTPTPARFVEAEHPHSIRVTRIDGAVLTVNYPLVRGDSLVGAVSVEKTPTTANPLTSSVSSHTWGDTASSRAAIDTTGVALNDVASVAVTKASGGKTALLVMGVILVPIAAAFTIFAIECPSGEC